MSDRVPDRDDPDAIRNALSAKIPAHQIKRRKIGGGREVPYVPGDVVIDILNRSTTEWSAHVTERWKETLDVTRWNNQAKQNELVERECLCVLIEMTIPGLGTRPGMGVQILEPGGGEDPQKGALTDAIKNAAKQFGVALELYGSGLTGGQSATEGIPENPDYAPPTQQQGAPQGGERGPMEPTEKQSGMIERLARELSLSAAELDAICQETTRYPLNNIGRKSASALIDKLQELKAQGGTQGKPTPGAGQTTPASAGTAGTGVTPDDVTVKRWLKTIEGAKTIVQLNQMETTLKDTGLIGQAEIAKAIQASAERITKVPQDQAGDVPF